MFRSSLSILLLTATFVLFAHDARAGFSISYTPNGSDLIWSSYVTYSLVGSEPDYNATAWRWQYKSPASSTWVDMTATPNGSTESCYELSVGTYDIRCLVTLSDTPGGPPVTGENPRPVTGSITIPPPDGIVYVSGDGVDTQVGDGCPVIFRVKCKGKFTGMPGGLPMEQITNIKDATGKVVQRATGWNPTSYGSQKFYWSSSNEITDIKKFSRATQNYYNSGPGVFNTVTQEIGIKINTNGVQKLWTLSPKYTVQFYKNSDHTYRLIHTAN